MIRTVEALNFRCLRYVRQDLDRFHVLVGPNASGKTTFLDVIRFLGRLVSGDLDAAIRERSENLQDLVWLRQGTRFELAVEVEIPKELRSLVQPSAFTRCRYEVAVGVDPETQGNSVLAEQLFLITKPLTGDTPGDEKPRLFPCDRPCPTSIISETPIRNSRTIVKKFPSGVCAFFEETAVDQVQLPFRLGPAKSALKNLPEDESKFPVSTWLKRNLTESMHYLVFNSMLMRKPCPPGRPKGLQTDGSNLPWVIEDLGKKAPHRKRDWLAHLRTALPDLEDVYTIERPEDRHRYLVVRYAGGLEVPSWVLSDGTLRLLALTLLAYLPDLQGIYLIEEPENGIHPRAVETAFQSLSSVYQAQVLLATHSPVIVGLAEPEQVLCFARTEEGATDIVRSSEHPALRDWQRETNLGVLYAAGVLG